MGPTEDPLTEPVARPVEGPTEDPLTEPVARPVEGQQRIH